MGLIACHKPDNKTTDYINISELSFDSFEEGMKEFEKIINSNSQDSLYKPWRTYSQTYMDSISFNDYKLEIIIIDNPSIAKAFFHFKFISPDRNDSILASFQANNFYKFSDEMKVLNQITKQNPVTDTYISIREGDLALDCSYIKNDSSWYKRFATSKENEEAQYLYITSEELDSIISKMNDYKKLIERK